MIALILALAAADPPPAPVDGLPVAALPRQSLPVKGCAAYLFSGGATRALVAMASAEAGTLRLAIDGPAADLARGTQSGTAGFGFAATTEYRAGEMVATLDLEVKQRRDLTQGAVVDAGTLRIDRPGKDSIVLPVAGIIGCAT